MKTLRTLLIASLLGLAIPGEAATIDRPDRTGTLPRGLGVLLAPPVHWSVGTGIRSILPPPRTPVRCTCPCCHDHRIIVSFAGKKRILLTPRPQHRKGCCCKPSKEILLPLPMPTRPYDRAPFPRHHEDPDLWRRWHRCD